MLTKRLLFKALEPLDDDVEIRIRPEHGPTQAPTEVWVHLDLKRGSHIYLSVRGAPAPDDLLICKL